MVPDGRGGGLRRASDRAGFCTFQGRARWVGGAPAPG